MYFKLNSVKYLTLISEVIFKRFHMCFSFNVKEMQMKKVILSIN